MWIYKKYVMEHGYDYSRMNSDMVETSDVESQLFDEETSGDMKQLIHNICQETTKDKETHPFLVVYI